MTSEIWTSFFAKVQTVRANQKENTTLMGDHILCLPPTPPLLLCWGERNFAIIYLKSPAIFMFSLFLPLPLWINLFIKGPKWLKFSVMKGKNWSDIPVEVVVLEGKTAWVEELHGEGLICSVRQGKRDRRSSENSWVRYKCNKNRM